MNITLYHPKALRRVGKSMGLVTTQVREMTRIIESINFNAIIDMQKQMEAETIAEITEDMIESVMEKTMMDYDAARTLLISARLDDLWKENYNNEGE